MVDRRMKLKAQREALGISQETLAHRLGLSSTTIRAWERGTQMPRMNIREALARELGVSVTQLRNLLGLSVVMPLNGEALNGAALAGVAEWLSMFVKAEQGASQAKVYEVVNLPALLQTPEYALALERIFHRPSTDSETMQRVEMRVARAVALDRVPQPLRLTVRFPWYVLEQEAGNPGVMVRQLDHLLQMAERPNVDLRIIPKGAAKVLAPGSFTVLATAGSPNPDFAAEFGLRGFKYHDEAPEVQDYLNLYQRITDAAGSPFESTNILRASREDYRRR
jgi:transcriptional regulator with XRE-family HTH domain